MANTKIYTVVKDGEELDQMKTLTAAKKLADVESAEVYCDGKCVYQGTVNAEIETAIAQELEGQVEETEAPVQEQLTQDGQSYRLKALMNVRRKPNGAIVRTLPAGTTVEVTSVENDWLHLKDGTFILLGGGKFAEKL